MAVFKPKRKASESVVANLMASIFGIKKLGKFEDTVDVLLEEDALPTHMTLHPWEEDVFAFMRNPDIEDHSLGQELYMDMGATVVVRDTATSGKHSLWTVTSMEYSHVAVRGKYKGLTIINHVKESDVVFIATQLNTITTACDMA